MASLHIIDFYTLEREVTVRNVPFLFVYLLFTETFLKYDLFGFLLSNKQYLFGSMKKLYVAKIKQQN